MLNIKEHFQTEGCASYRPLPFWSWNDKLEKKKLIDQIHWMRENGIGGFFMHARSGLKTEYLGKKWFDCIRACCAEAKKLGMDAWAYDENGWPSGFGCGAVNGLGVEYQQKYLRCEQTDSPKTTDRTITNVMVDGKNNRHLIRITYDMVDSAERMYAILFHNSIDQVLNCTIIAELESLSNR